MKKIYKSDIGQLIGWKVRQLIKDGIFDKNDKDKIKKFSESVINMSCMTTMHISLILNHWALLRHMTLTNECTEYRDEYAEWMLKYMLKAIESETPLNDKEFKQMVLETDLYVEYEWIDSAKFKSHLFTMIGFEDKMDIFDYFEEIQLELPKIIDLLVYGDKDKIIEYVKSI